MLKHAKLNDCVGKKLTKVVWCNLQVYMVFEDVYAGITLYVDEDGEHTMKDASISGTDYYTLMQVGVLSEEEYKIKQKLQQERTKEWEEKRDKETYERLKKKYETPT